MRDQDIPRRTYDPRLTDVQREAVDRAHAEGRRPADRQPVLSGEDAGAGAFAIMALFLALLILMLYTALFPLTGAITIGAMLLYATVVDEWLIGGTGGIGPLLFSAPWTYLAFELARRLENSLQASRTFRRIRVLARVAATAVLGWFVVAFLHAARVFSGPPRETFSAAEIGAIAAAIVVVHFAGRWYDRRLAVALGEVEAPAGGDASRARGAVRRASSLLALQWLPAGLRRGLAAFALGGALVGMFLGYAGFETRTAMVAGLLLGTAAGVAAMFVFWLVTWPVRGLFVRLPFLWPLLVGAVLGAVVAWRFSIADQVPLDDYLISFAVGGAVVLTVPYLAYRGIRRLVA